MAEFEQLAQAQAADPFANTLAKIDRQLTIHDAYEKSQSYLGTAFDFVWRQDENSHKALKNVRDRVETAHKSNDVGALEKMQDEVRKSLEKDSKAVKLQSEINFYGGTTAKVASIFVAGPVGWTAAGALYALDSARPADSWNHQLIDGTLGAASGLALKGMFGYARTIEAPFYAKGVGMGMASRLIDNTLNRHTYLNPETGSVDIAHGTKQILKNTFNPAALATDVAVFTVGYGLGAGLNRFAGPALTQNRVFSQLAGAGVWGASSGGVREAARQVAAKETINLGKIGFHSALGAGLFTLAAVPGTLQAEWEYQKMVAAQNAGTDGSGNDTHHKNGADGHGKGSTDLKPNSDGTLNVPQDRLVAFKKVGTVQAEQLKTAQQWQTSKGDMMQGQAGDWKVTGPDGSTWTVKPDIFNQTYSQVPGQSGVFAKTAITRAIQLDKPVVIKTLEGTGTGDAGDYLVVGPKGEQYIVPKAKFESSYKPIEVKPSVVPSDGQINPADHGKVVGYQKMGTVKAELMDKSQEWTTTTGNTMKGEAGDYLITGADGSKWTIKSDIFKQTYAEVPGQPGQYAKSVITRAVVLTKPATVMTLEGEGSGNPGDYLVIGAKGEQYIVAKAKFESMYKPASEK